MADGGETIVLDQVRHHCLEQAGQPMQHLDQGAEGHAELFGDGAQRDPVAIVQQQDPSDQLIAQQMFGQHAGGLGLQAAAAAGAILFLQPINDLLGLQGRTVEDGTQPYAFVLQWAATVGTERGSRAGFEVVGLGSSKTFAAVAGMSRLGAAGMRAVFLSGRGLEGDFRRRGGGAKESLFGLAVAIAQLLLQALILLFQLIDALLFVETTGTKGHTHPSSSAGGTHCGGVAVFRRCCT